MTNGAGHPNRSARAQRGQALVEAAVLGAALMPLLLAIPLLAKYQDIRHAAIAASRTAAFECSVRPATCGEPQAQAVVADALRRRHFARHDHDLLSDDAIAADPAAAERNRFWVDRRGADLLAQFPDVALRLEAGESDALRGAWRGNGAAGPGAFGLDVPTGMITAQVRARVSVQHSLEQWLTVPEGLALALTGKTAIIVDSWNASSCLPVPTVY